MAVSERGLRFSCSGDLWILRQSPKREAAGSGFLKPTSPHPRPQLIFLISINLQFIHQYYSAPKNKQE